MVGALLLTVNYYPLHERLREGDGINYLELALFCAVLISVMLLPTCLCPPMWCANQCTKGQLTTIINDVNKSSFGKKGKVTLSDPVYFAGCCQKIANYRVIEIEYGRYHGEDDALEQSYLDDLRRNQAEA